MRTKRNTKGRNFIDAQARPFCRNERRGSIRPAVTEYDVRAPTGHWSGKQAGVQFIFAMVTIAPPVPGSAGQLERSFCEKSIGLTAPHENDQCPRRGRAAQAVNTLAVGRPT
uniref:Uncharacterized protein n=1 Tax=Plectus sambesii TaxID=2011161 RepID=A0A914XLE6_9BILA